MSEIVHDLKVEPGMLVEVELVSALGEVERLTFTLVEDEQADFQAGFLGSGTTLAKTILGHYPDSTLDYKAGDLQFVRILSVEPSDKIQTEDINSRRKTLMRKALDHSDYVNALIFATSVNSKWGDYDIDSLDPEQWNGET
ncbi:MAG: hypothetical protein ABIJ65_06140 [Chloroflexota bacterium]